MPCHAGRGVMCEAGALGSSPGLRASPASRWSLATMVARFRGRDSSRPFTSGAAKHDGKRFIAGPDDVQRRWDRRLGAHFLEGVGPKPNPATCAFWLRPEWDALPIGI